MGDRVWSSVSVVRKVWFTSKRQLSGIGMKLAASFCVMCIAFSFTTTMGRADVFQYDAHPLDAEAAAQIAPETESVAPSGAASPAKSAFEALARSVARQHRNSPTLVLAGLTAQEFEQVFVSLVRQESNFRPEAVSNRGAMGLGQLMPGTAAELGVTQPFDPLENLEGSAMYLMQQINEFVDLRLALAAYNAGAGTVKKHGGIPPFSETQDYVIRVLKDAGWATRHTANGGTDGGISERKGTHVWEY
jgi:hypothetical protein